MSLEQLKKDISVKKPGSLYVFYGQEEYLKKQYMDKLMKLVPEKGTEALNCNFFEGSFYLDDIINAAETMPVFSERKLVTVKESGYFSTGKKALSEKDAEKLIKFLDNVPGFTCLIFYEENIDKKLKKLLNKVENKGLIVEFGFQNTQQLVKWIMEVAGERNKKINTITASKFLEYCEPDMNSILNEFEKVMAFIEERELITAEDFDTVCTRSIKTRIFDLTNAIVEGKAEKALKLLDDMLSLKEPVFIILYMISKQFRLIMQYKLLKKQNPYENAESKLRISPYAAKIVVRQAERIDSKRVFKAMQKCLEAELLVKTGRMKEQNALEILIGSIC